MVPSLITGGQKPPATSSKGPKSKWYAVRPGSRKLLETDSEQVQPGVFLTYEKAQAAVSGKSFAMHKSFDNPEAAFRWSLELDDASQVEGDGRLEYPSKLLEQCRQRDQLANMLAIPSKESVLSIEPQTNAGVKIAQGIPGVTDGNGHTAADCDGQTTADALSKKRKLASGIMVGGEPQQSAAKKASGGIVVPALVPLGQLQPGAALEVILAAEPKLTIWN